MAKVLFLVVLALLVVILPAYGRPNTESTNSQSSEDIASPDIDPEIVEFFQAMPRSQWTDFRDGFLNPRLREAAFAFLGGGRFNGFRNF